MQFHFTRLLFWDATVFKSSKFSKDFGSGAGFRIRGLTLQHGCVSTADEPNNLHIASRFKFLKEREGTDRIFQTIILYFLQMVCLSFKSKWLSKQVPQGFSVRKVYMGSTASRC